MTPADAAFRRNAPFIVALLAVAASITGVTNGFALDDVQLIVANDRLHHLSRAFDVFSQTYWPPAEGSSLYRPFTSLAFLLQWVIGSGSPLPFHIVSIALYAAVSVAVYAFASLLTEWKTALLAAMLFAAHPLHVEAVANVVGQAELWAALFAIAALYSHVRARQRGTVAARSVITTAAFYGIALMFKEHVIVLPAIIVVYELLFPGREWRAALPALVAMGVVGLAFVVLRTAVIGQLQGGGVSPIFADESFTARLLTMLRVSGEWIRLLVWPANLSADYSPSRIRIATGFHGDMLPGLLVIVSAAVLGVRIRRTQPVIAFAIFASAILLLVPSNLVVVTGFVLAERTLFLPSVAVLLGLSCGVMLLVRDRPRTVLVAGASLVVAAGVIRSSLRNPVWKDNETLIINTVMDSPTSARAHMMMAQLLSDHRLQKKAVAETVRALELGSGRDSQLFAFAADMFQMAGDCRTAAGLYARSLALRADQAQVRINASACASRLASSGE